MEDGIVLFTKGEKVWIAAPDTELSLDVHAVEHMIGSGPFSIERAVDAPPHMPCSKVHPQMLYLLDPNGDAITVLGAEFPWPGFLFTKEDITSGEIKYAIEESEKATGWIKEAQAAIDKAMGESEELIEIMKRVEADDHIMTIGASVGIARKVKEETEIKEPTSFVQNGEVVEDLFSEKDMEEFQRNFRIKLD